MNITPSFVVLRANLYADDGDIELYIVWFAERVFDDVELLLVH